MVPEPVDTDFFDPGRVAALPLPKGRPMFGRTKQRPAQPFVLLSVCTDAACVCRCYAMRCLGCCSEKILLHHAQQPP